MSQQKPENEHKPHITGLSMTGFSVYADSIERHVKELREVDGVDQIKTYRAFESMFCLIMDAEHAKAILANWLPKTTVKGVTKDWGQIPTEENSP